MNTYRIYPAIGVARVGDARQKFYIGPEAYRGLPLNPDGAPFTERDFRDAEGRMCRQAARFKICRDTPQGRWRAACRGRSFPLWTWSPQAGPSLTEDAP